MKESIWNMYGITAMQLFCTLKAPMNHCGRKVLSEQHTVTLSLSDLPKEPDPLQRTNGKFYWTVVQKAYAPARWGGGEDMNGDNCSVHSLLLSNIDTNLNTDHIRKLANSNHPKLSSWTNWYICKHSTIQICLLFFLKEAKNINLCWGKLWSSTIIPGKGQDFRCKS